MKIGLIGYGAWGQLHAGAISRLEGLELGGIVCHSDQSEAAASRAHPGVPIHLGTSPLLRDASIDLVDIVAPNHLHAEMALAALAAGKHVLIEKPLATSIADGQRVVDAVERSGLYLGVGHELHVSKQWCAVRDIIDGGAIGRPRHGSVTLFRRPYRPGSGGWRRTPERVGSWILEEPVHYFDLLLWYFAGHGRPVEVEAFGTPSGLGPGMYDTFTCRLGFANGDYAMFSQCLAGFEHSLTVEIVGTDGALRTWWQGAMDRTETPTFELKLRRAGAETVETVPIGKSGEVFELEEQLRRLIVDVPARRPLVSARDALAAVKVCLVAEDSVRAGRPLRLDW